MVASNMGSAPAEPSKKKQIPKNCGPMSQQGAMGGHGHEMHPQEFVRLIGCREARMHKEDDVLELH